VPCGAGVPPQSSLDVSHVTAVMLNFEFRPTANLGLQLATSLGGTLDVDGAGGLAAQVRIVKATPYSLAAFVNYHFFDEANALRPFLGIGANFTGFAGVQSCVGQAADMSSSWSPAVQAGVRYVFDRNWSLLFSLGLNWAMSDFTLSSPAGTRQAQLEFRPVVFGLGVGYSF
jgi:outer membrane protein